jgi:glycerol uptake facilitator-like aquaporin
MERASLGRRLAAEAIGTALLLATVVGSGIMGERLAGGNAALALLANALATGFGLIALILTFGPVSGAHFNPLVTVAVASQRGISRRDALLYIGVQIIGALIGVALANLMFDLPVYAAAQKVRQGFGQLLSEVVATFGLLSVIWGCARHRPSAVPFAVGAYITAGYWFTASTAVANPAVALARSLTDTFSGIRPIDVPGFVLAQIIGAALAMGVFRWLIPHEQGARP